MDFFKDLNKEQWLALLPFGIACGLVGFGAKTLLDKKSKSEPELTQDTQDTPADINLKSQSFSLSSNEATYSNNGRHVPYRLNSRPRHRSERCSTNENKSEQETNGDLKSQSSLFSSHEAANSNDGPSLHRRQNRRRRQRPERTQRSSTNEVHWFHRGSKTEVETGTRNRN